MPEDDDNFLNVNITKVGKVLAILAALYIVAQVAILMPYRMSLAEKNITALQLIATDTRGSIIEIKGDLKAIKKVSEDNNEMLKQHLLKP